MTNAQNPQLQAVGAETKRLLLPLLIIVAVMWGVEIIDRLLFHGALDGLGILPRQVAGLRGIPIAPLLHGSFAHLMANTLTFLALAFLVMLRHNFHGLERWIALGEQLSSQFPENAPPDMQGRFASSMLMALLICNQSHPDLPRWQSYCENLLDRCTDPQVLVDLIKNLCWTYGWKAPMPFTGNCPSLLWKSRTGSKKEPHF